MDALTRRIAAALILLAATVAAQTNTSSWNTVRALTAGTDVRVVNGSRAIRGRLEAVTDETMVVSSATGRDTFARQEVTRVSLQNKSHRRRNVLFGAGIGGGAGFVLGAAAAGACKGTICGGHGPELAFALGGAGALLGTLIGAVVPAAGWREIYKK